MSTATEPAPTTNGAALQKIDPTRPCTPGQLRDLMSRQVPELEGLYAPALRSSAARLARAVVTEVIKNPDLAKCTGASVVSCAIQAAQLNLEIGGPTGQSYMVPYAGKATFQLGYRGMITLAFRSRSVKSITAQEVKEGDEFEVQYGTAPGIAHRPGKARGATTHVYAVVTYHGGGIDFEVMTVPEVDEHRKKYSKQGNANGARAGVWASAFSAMALKTVIRKLLKRCPIGVDAGLLDEPGETPAAAEPPADRAADRPAPRQVAAAREPDLEALMARKGVSPGDAADWLNREYEAGYDELPPAADLPPAARQALAEYLAGLPDAQAVGS